MPTEDEIKSHRQRALIAIANAKAILKPGDRIRVSKCPGRKRWITFATWDSNWIVSKTGVDDYSAACVDMLNGKPVDFCHPIPGMTYITDPEPIENNIEPYDFDKIDEEIPF